MRDGVSGAGGVAVGVRTTCPITAGMEDGVGGDGIMLQGAAV